MTFYAVELDICPAYGWQGGPNGNTQITPLQNRHEHRNSPASLVQHTFSLPFQNIHDDAYLQYLKSAHMAMWAMRHSFLVKDWLDFLAVNQPLGVAPSGSTAVQLQRTYPFGPASRTRPITKPVAGAVIYQADGSGNPVAKPGTLDTLTGLFIPSTAWTAGRALSWEGEFRVPVRFNSDYLPMTIDSRAGEHMLLNGSVDLIEVFGE